MFHIIEVLPTSSWGYEIQYNQFDAKSGQFSMEFHSRQLAALACNVI